MSTAEDWESAAPRGRRVLTILGLVVVALIAGIALGGTAPSGEFAPTGELLVTEVPDPQLTEPVGPVSTQITGRWQNMAGGPLAGRVGAATAWTGSEMLIWSGVGPSGFTDGALYDPLRDHWREMAKGPLPARFGAAALWDGDEVVIAGGVAASGVQTRGRPPRRLLDAAAYNPETASWRRLPDVPFPVTTGHLFARSGTLYVVASHASQRPLAALDNGSALWRMLPSVAWDAAGDEIATARSEDTLLLWPQGQGDMVTYDLAAQEWTPVPHDPVGVLDGCTCELVAGTNASGGVDIVVYDKQTPRWWRRHLGPVQPSFADGTKNLLYLVYNPSRTRALGRRTGILRTLPLEPQTLGYQPVAVWTGTRLLLWGGVSGVRNRFNADGLIFRRSDTPVAN